MPVDTKTSIGSVATDQCQWNYIIFCGLSKLVLLHGCVPDKISALHCAAKWGALGHVPENVLIQKILGYPIVIAVRAQWASYCNDDGRRQSCGSFEPQLCDQLHSMFH